ncbi:hypothetical protein H2202_004022 [Exophiala xenobiotica]|nr:hypothetical protein H2202_004022 [Exophiala xenobiotica]KAK5204934.1 hypothetical protein LTR41_009471 [Exophiala xenobiotica]KAK5353249.1 hypothetical protein LTR61_003207 [Exophiala xenobiotica]KAK5380030.1 hypothetical protein LTR11_003659 [Exophiala xenobiotica]KAK5410580.1 hypothetical protein LTR90_008163 [Exophiala xenobiotica]
MNRTVHSPQPAATVAKSVRPTTDRSSSSATDAAAYDLEGRRAHADADTLYRINDEVIIRLKWGQTEYKGRLISVDSYMNIQLSNTEEYIDRKHTGTLGEVLIRYGPVACQIHGSNVNKTIDRCNNVLWISAAKGVEMNGEADTKMEG